MKNILKKINAMALAAMLIGGGFAYATTQKAEAPMYKFHNEVWEPIPPGEIPGCEDSELDCTATELINGQPAGVITKGLYSPRN